VLSSLSFLVSYSPFFSNYLVISVIFCYICCSLAVSWVVWSVYWCLSVLGSLSSDCSDLGSSFSLSVFSTTPNSLSSAWFLVSFPFSKCSLGYSASPNANTCSDFNSDLISMGSGFSICYDFITSSPCPICSLSSLMLLSSANKLFFSNCSSSQAWLNWLRFSLTRSVNWRSPRSLLTFFLRASIYSL
jgi:hypothetical protein